MDIIEWYNLILSVRLQVLLNASIETATLILTAVVINLAANPKTNRPSTSVHRFCRGSAMDAGRLEQQVASVERGITFLKQEHLAMLTGLQLEITHLKRRCHGQCTGELLLPSHYVLTCLIFVCLPACCTTAFLACRAELWAGLQVSRQKHSRWEITNPCWAREKTIYERRWNFIS